MDRSVRKILSLPLFGDDICQWLVDRRMAQFEKLSAVSDGSISECVQAFVDLVPALEDLHTPSRRKTEESMIELLFERAGMGFGLAGAPVSAGRSPLKTKVGGDDQPVPLALAKRPRAIEPASEMGEARKWGMRLKASVERCSEHAAIAGDPKAGSPLSRDVC